MRLVSSVLVASALAVALGAAAPARAVPLGFVCINASFMLAAGATFANVIDALTDGSLRIGLRGQQLDDGGTRSFVNVAVPEPASLLLLGAGVLGLAALRARR